MTKDNEINKILARDIDDGTWDDKSFDIDTLFQINSKMSKEAMIDTRESAMNHAMVITGVNLENDTPTKWKIKKQIMVIM